MTNELYASKAREVDDRSYQALDPEVLEMYLQVPPMDLEEIPFNTSVVRVTGERNLSNYLKAIASLPPSERVISNRRAVTAMRYVSAEDSAQDQRAYAEFISGRSPYPDLLTFLLSSPDLEEAGDGDCDVHNTAFVLLNRLSGVPSRVSDVITAEGVAHMVSEVYFPNEGWVEMDATGVELHPNHPRNKPKPAVSEEEKLRAGQEYADLQCDDLAEKMQ